MSEVFQSFSRVVLSGGAESPSEAPLSPCLLLGAEAWPGPSPSCWERQAPQPSPSTAAHPAAVSSLRKHRPSSLTCTTSAFSSLSLSYLLSFRTVFLVTALTLTLTGLNVPLCLDLLPPSTYRLPSQRASHPFPPPKKHSMVLFDSVYFRKKGLKGLKACACPVGFWSPQLLIWPLDYGTSFQQRQLCPQEPPQSCNRESEPLRLSQEHLPLPPSRPLFPTVPHKLVVFGQPL